MTASLHALPETSSPASRLCVIDLGTNSFHALIVDPLADGGFNLVDKLKLPVALGEAGLETKVLTHDAVSRAVHALRQISTLAHRRDAESIVAYATSAVRDAVNGSEFVDHVQGELGINIESIEGAREAHLIYLGVRRALELPAATLLVDIGGGSTELVIGDSQRSLHETSLPLGAARLSQQFIASDPASGDDLDALRDHLEEVLEPVFDVAREGGVKEIVGSSGTMENLLRLAMGERAGQPEQHVFSAEEVLETTADLVDSTRAERRELSGLDDRRVDQIVAGAVLVETLIEGASIETLRFSPAAMREGMVADLVGGPAAEPIEPGADLIAARARELCTHHGADLEHAKQVASLADDLFTELSPVHRLGDKERRLLHIAALVHDVGHTISGRRHHKHSRYIIEQTDWPGVSPRQIHMIAAIARYHRRARPKKKHREMRRLGKKDRKRVRKLAAILRLADKLDRSHIGNTRRARVGVSAREVHVTVATRLSPDLELDAARTLSRCFVDAFDRDLIVHAAWHSRVIGDAALPGAEPDLQ